MKRIAASALFLVAFLGTAGAQADIYRWKDNQGQMHYTENPPPPGNKDRGTVIRTTGPATGAQEQAQKRSESVAERLKTFRDNRAEKQKKESERKTETERLAQNCDAAKSNLAKLENRRLRRLTDNEGNVTVLTEEERQKKIEEARKVVRENCK